MNYFGTNVEKGEKLEHLEVGIQILFSSVWENLSSEKWLTVILLSFQ